MASKKKYWIKRSLLPEDKNDRAQVTKVVRWRVANGKQMCMTLGPDTVIEGDFDNQPDLEPYKKPEVKKSEVKKPESKKPDIRSEKIEKEPAEAATKSDKVSGKGKKRK